MAGAATMLAVAAGTAVGRRARPLHAERQLREEPDAHSRIVALCEAGTKVQLGDERDGCVHIDELGGWASKDYVKPDEPRARSDSSSGDRSDGSDDATRRADGDDAAARRQRRTRSGSTQQRLAGRPTRQRLHDGTGDSGDGEHRSGADAGDDAHLDGLLG